MPSKKGRYIKLPLFFNNYNFSFYLAKWFRLKAIEVVRNLV